MDPIDRVKELIFIVERMNEIMRKENAHLKKHEIKAIGETLEEKNKLSRFYEKHVKVLAMRADELKEVDAELREHLKEISKEMEELSTINGRLLKEGMSVGRRVINLIADAAKKNTPTAGTYGGDGTIGGPKGTINAVSLNQEL